MAPFFKSSFYSPSRRRRHTQNLEKISLEDAFASPSPLALHSYSLPNLEELRGLSASFVEELGSIVQSPSGSPSSSQVLSTGNLDLPAVPLTQPSEASIEYPRADGCQSFLAPEPALATTGTKDYSRYQSLSTTSSQATVRLATRKSRRIIIGVATMSARDVEAENLKLIQELTQDIDELSASFLGMSPSRSSRVYPVYHPCPHHGPLIESLEQDINQQKQNNCPLEIKTEELTNYYNILKMENYHLNRVLTYMKKGGLKPFHKQEHEIRQLNRFVSALLDIKLAIVGETTQDGSTTDAAVVAAIKCAARKHASLWSTVISAVTGKCPVGLHSVEVARSVNLTDELGVITNKYRAWKVLAQKDLRHQNYKTPSPSTMSLFLDGIALKPRRVPVSGPVDVLVDRLIAGNFPVRYPRLPVVTSANLGTGRLTTPSQRAAVKNATPYPDVQQSNPLLYTVDEITASPVDNEESSTGTEVNPGLEYIDEFPVTASTEPVSTDSQENPGLECIENFPASECHDSVLLDAGDGSDQDISMSICVEQTNLPILSEDVGSESGRSPPGTWEPITNTVESWQDDKLEDIAKYPADGRRNPVFRDCDDDCSDELMTILPFQRRIGEYHAEDLHQSILCGYDDSSSKDINPFGSRHNLALHDCDDSSSDDVPLAFLSPARLYQVAKPAYDNARVLESPMETSFVSAVVQPASSSIDSLKRISAMGSLIKQSISSGLQRLRELPSKLIKKQNPTQRGYQSVAPRQHHRTSSAPGKESKLPHSNNRHDGSRRLPAPSRQPASLPSGSHRPTISSASKATPANHVSPSPTPSRLPRRATQKSQVNAVLPGMNMNPPRRLPLTKLTITSATPKNGPSHGRKAVRFLNKIVS